MLNILILSLILSSAAYGEGCPWEVGGDIIITETPEPRENQDLSKTDLLEDLDCLELILKLNYVVLKTNKDNNLISNLIELKREIKAKDSNAFLEDIFGLHEGLIDFHLSYSLETRKRFQVATSRFGLPYQFKLIDGYYEGVNEETSEPLLGCDSVTPELINEAEGIYLFILESGRNPSEEINCELKSGKMVKIDSAYPVSEFYINNERFEVDKIYELDSNTVYVKPGSLMTFSKLQQEVIDYIKTTEKNIILDLTSNPGGENVYANKFTKSIYTPEEHIPGFEVLEIQSHLKTIGFLNSFYLMGVDYWSEYSDFMNSVKSAPIKSLVETTIEKSKESFRGERGSKYTGKLAILTSSNCMSACETFVEQLSPHSNSFVLGQNTAGMIHFGNATTYFLPNSGISMYIPTHAAVYENDTPEGVGYPVDVEMKYIDLSSPEKLFKYID